MSVFPGKNASKYLSRPASRFHSRSAPLSTSAKSANSLPTQVDDKITEAKELFIAKSFFRSICRPNIFFEFVIFKTGFVVIVK